MSASFLSSTAPALHPAAHQLHSVSVGVYDRSLDVVRVSVLRGKVINHMGHHRAGVLCLFIEEALSADHSDIHPTSCRRSTSPSLTTLPTCLHGQVSA